MKKNISGLLILLLTLQLSLAQNSYPKKLIIQNSKNETDTIIAYTNEQVQKINQEHVILKQCIEYSDIQDTMIKNQKKNIESLQLLNTKLIFQDSISRSQIVTQSQIILQKDKQYSSLEENFNLYKKEVKKTNRKTWLYNSFVGIPILITITATLTYFLTK